MCDTPDVEPIDISEANSCNLFVIGVVEDKEKLKIFWLLIPPMNISKLELKLQMAAKKRVHYIIKWSNLWNYVFIGYKMS